MRLAVIGLGLGANISSGICGAGHEIVGCFEMPQ